MYDAIVVGARAAGPPLAMNLARAGKRVLAVDRESFPGPARHAEALTGHAVHRLQKWGLLDALIAANTPPMTHVTMNVGDTVVEFPVPSGVPGYCPRRDILDQILIDAARESGVEVREKVSVTDVLRDENGRVTGIVGTGPDGDEIREEAGIVIGADGRKSVIAAAVQARTYNEKPGRTCAFFSTWHDVPVDGIEAYFLPGCALIIYPTNDGTTTLGALFPVEQYDQLKERAKEVVTEALNSVPGLAMRLLCCGSYDGNGWGFRWPGSYYRDIHGPGWVLAGDAAFLKEPILGQGVNDAFRDADHIAQAIIAASNDEELAKHLQEYQDHRDAITPMLYQATYEFAGLNVTPQMLNTLASYATSQA